MFDELSDYLFNIIFLNVMIVLLLWPIILSIIFIIKRKKIKSLFKQNVVINNKVSNKKIYRDINPSKLGEFDEHDLEKLKKYLYDIFFKFENAYNEIDYNTMHNLSTPSLYDMYYNSIKLSQSAHEKKIINNINIKEIIIYDAYSSKVKQSISTLIDIEYISYTQNSKGIVISGSINPTRERFEVDFIKYLDKEKATNKCPNCGANMSSSVCEYCNTKINNYEFRINSIKKIIEK